MRMRGFYIDAETDTWIAAEAAAAGVSYSVFVRAQLKKLHYEDRLEKLLQEFRQSAPPIQDLHLMQDMLAEVLVILRRLVAERNPQAMQQVRLLAQQLIVERQREAQP